MAVPQKSRIVIIGGGVIGCSIAYHLAKRGERDVVLLERLQLTHGATWHAAGLVGQLRSSSNLTRLMRYRRELYGKLEAETGQATGWHGVGSLRLASSPARWRELKRSATMAKGFGFHVELVSPRAKRASAFRCSSSKASSAPRGSRATATSIRRASPTPMRPARAPAACASLQGVRVTAPRAPRPARRRRVVTDHGRHRSRVRDQRRRHVGPRDRGDGRHARSRVRRRAPVLRHREDGPRFPPDLPTLRDPDAQLLREAGARRVGRRRLGSRTRLRGAPTAFAHDFGPELLQPDFDRFAPLAEAAAARIPVLERGRHSADDQRPDPDHRGRRADHRPVARARQFLPVLRLHLGHRRVGRRRLGDGELDRRRRSRAWTCGRSTCAASARRIRSSVHVRARRRKLRRATTTSHGRTTIPTPAAARAAVRCTRRCSTRAPSTATSSAGSGPTGSATRGHASRSTCRRSSAGRRSRRSAPSIARCASASRIIDMSSFSKYEVRGPGALALLQKLAVQRPRPARRHHRLHAALQRARRHRGRRHDHAARGGPLLLRHRQRARRARPLDDRAAHARRRQRHDRRPHVRARPCSTCAARARATCSRS